MNTGTPTPDTVTRPSTAAARSALVVDDDKLMLAMMGDMLRDAGVSRVTSAASGAAGLEAYDRAASPPDVVVCDLSMPGTDGFQFMQELATRSFKGGVIVVSGQDARVLKSAGLMARFHQLDFIGTLAKPVDPAALADALGASRVHA